MQTEPRLPVTDESEALEFLELLEGAPFSAPYTGQVIDWLIRDSTVHAPEASPAARAVAALCRYAAGHDLGAGEIAERVRDVAHAMSLVAEEHYAADPSPRRHRPVHGRSVRKLCVAAGRRRSLAGPGRTVVIAQGIHGHTVFRPVAPSMSPDGPGETLRREVLTVLAAHVHLADRRTFQGSGVLVESRHESVEVTWWSPDPEAGPGHHHPAWSTGGVRLLCSALLRGEGMKVTVQPNGALLVAR
ncbi:hypothetical protein PYK79_08430 [Streptomyces sp. ID05-04B]|uniref:hypothetical protein n=1 Tax=Streptomyces sp. ID05-04B TaxID=3028661 RepID=UPI0029C20E0B|nr:hypothetical protein [Streptomyces sp. ID05-04B]MDX5563286.1 hypothetical protein [Streptomyces sp. ID05-04B]